MLVPFLQFLLWILVGAFVGWLTGRKLKRYGYGPVLDLSMGAAGATGGAFLVGAAGPSLPAMLSGLLGSLVGAVMLTTLVAWVSGERRHAWAGEGMQQGQQSRRWRSNLSQPEDDALY